MIARPPRRPPEGGGLAVLVVVTVLAWLAAPQAHRLRPLVDQLRQGDLPGIRLPRLPAPPPARGPGGRACPVDGRFAYGSGWGAARDGGARRHQGIDLLDRPPHVPVADHHAHAQRRGAACPCPSDLEVPPLMWSSLPSNLRTVLGTALLLGVGVAVAAFTLSFFALREAAQDPALRWGQGHAWLFPIGVDMALVFFEVLLLGASMVRVHDHGRVVQYPRAVPFLLVLVAAAGTLYFNATHVPTQLRPIALAVPVASILVTLGLAYLLKMLAAASGTEAIHLAPPALEPHRIVARGDVLHGELLRDPEVPGDAPGPHGRAGGWGQVPSWAPSQLPQNGQQGVDGDGDRALAEATKRRRVEAYLAALGSNELGRLSSLGPRAAARELTGALNGQGVQVSERYVQQIFDDWTTATRQPANGRRRTR